MSPRTMFLSRLIGLYLILVSLAMVTHKRAMLEVITALIHDPPVLFVVAIMAVAAGLAMILGHNVWSGGVLPVIVTLIGWLTLIKGLFLLFLSPDMAPEFFLGSLHYEQMFYFYTAFSLLLGAYLTLGGSGSSVQ
jgi:hypothetical protein